MGKNSTSILFLGGIWPAYRRQLKARLGRGWRVACAGLQPAPDLFRRLRAAEVVITSTFPGAWVAHAPKLRLLHAPGAGYEKIELAALPAGVQVCQTFRHGPSIAEFVVMAMLALSRQLLQSDRDLRANRWRSPFWDNSVRLAGALEGRTALVLGTGEIGVHVARLCKVFGVRSLGINRSGHAVKPFDRTAPRGALPRLLPQADFLVVAIPLTAETHGLIGRTELARMKRTACLINVARGPIVEERALFQALKRRRIAGAALDAWYQYPIKNPNVAPARLPFRELDNVIMTPHISGWTTQTFDRRLDDMIENLRRWRRGEPLRNRVPRGSTPRSAGPNFSKKFRKGGS